MDALRALADPSKVTIAMIHGACMGGGAAIALACDLRFSDTNLAFSTPALRLGMKYGSASLRRLVKLIGPSHALDLMLSGEVVDSFEAQRLGLIDRAISRKSQSMRRELHAMIRPLAWLPTVRFGLVATPTSGRRTSSTKSAPDRWGPGSAWEAQFGRPHRR